MAHHDVPGHIAMRTKRYKLIQFYGTAGKPGYRSDRSCESTPAGWELYDQKWIQQKVIIFTEIKNMY